MLNKTPIRTHEALEIMARRDANGKAVPFQIAFYTSSPKLAEFKRIDLLEAVRTGLPVQHRHKRDLVGVAPLLKNKHLYSVNARLIVELNNQPVVP